MLPKFRAHVRSNFVGYVAIVIALVGVPSTWAIARNTVGSAQIKPKAVKNSDLAANAVTSPKVANGSLLGADFAPGQLPAGPTGPQGEAGPTGPKGEIGLQGPTGPAGPSTGPAGGDLTGNYPNPQLAADAVTGADVADNSVPGSDLLTNSVGAVKIQDGTLTEADVLDRGLDAEDIGLNLVVTVDLPSVPAGGCISSPATLGTAQLGEIVFILPTNGLQTNGLIFPPTIRDPAPLPDAVWQICNLTAGAIDPPSQDFRIMSISP